jgi:hypothetical protein
MINLTALEKEFSIKENNSNLIFRTKEYLLNYLYFYTFLFTR